MRCNNFSGFLDKNRSLKRSQTTNCKIVDLAVPADHRVELKESEKKNKYLDLLRELKNTLEHESDVYSNYNWSSWYSHQRIDIRTGGIGNNRTSGDYPNYFIIDIGQNTVKSSGDLGRVIVTQTPVKNPQLTVM